MHINKKVLEPVHNLTAYIYHYLSSLPAKIPELRLQTAYGSSPDPKYDSSPSAVFARSSGILPRH